MTADRAEVPPLNIVATEIDDDKRCVQCKSPSIFVVIVLTNGIEEGVALTLGIGNVFRTEM
jgi:hypothetical protein